jgi:hypothetical protein
MNDRELTQIVQNHTGFPWFNGKAYVEHHGIDVGQARIERIAELEGALTWYAAHVADCRKLGTVGDVARGKLDRDGGSKARAALVDKA